MTDTATLQKWIGDLEEAERRITASFPTNFANTDQIAQYYAAKEALALLKADLRKALLA